MEVFLKAVLIGYDLDLKDFYKLSDKSIGS